MSLPQKRPKAEKQKGKRGRPALKIQKVKDNFDPSQSMRSVIEHYEATKLSYECTYFTQQLCLMLQRIASHPSFGRFHKEPVYRSMIKAVKDVMLTELEVAVWSIVLTRSERDMEHADLMLHLRATAFAVRKVTEGDILLSGIEACLDMKPGFQRYFSKWYERNRDQLDMSLYEINEMYQFLVRPMNQQDRDEFVISYEIDEIIDEAVLSGTCSDAEDVDDKSMGKTTDRSESLKSITFGSGLDKNQGEQHQSRVGQVLIPLISSLPSFDNFELAPVPEQREEERASTDEKME